MSEEVLTRAEFLGGLIRKARLQEAHSVAECAAVLSKSAAEYELLESGEVSPSLPELEVLALDLARRTGRPPQRDVTPNVLSKKGKRWCCKSG